jgi:hypothetical protein
MKEKTEREKFEDRINAVLKDVASTGKPNQLRKI